MTQPGWSAQRLAEFGILLLQLIAGWLLIAAMVWGGVLLTTGTPHGVLLKLAQTWTVVAFALGAIASLLGIWGDRRAKSEARLRYTSTRGGYSELLEVAPGTSYVIRNAGDPALTDDEYFAALRRAEADGHRVDSARRRRSLLWIWIPLLTATGIFAAALMWAAAVGDAPVVYPIALVAAGTITGVFYAVRSRRHKTLPSTLEMPRKEVQKDETGAGGDELRLHHPGS